MALPPPPPPQDIEKIYRTVLYLTRKIKIYPKIYILAPLQNIYILTHEKKKKKKSAPAFCPLDIDPRITRKSSSLNKRNCP